MEDPVKTDTLSLSLGKLRDPLNCAMSVNKDNDQDLQFGGVVFVSLGSRIRRLVAREA